MTKRDQSKVVFDAAHAALEPLESRLLFQATAPTFPYLLTPDWQNKPQEIGTVFGTSGSDVISIFKLKKPDGFQGKFDPDFDGDDDSDMIGVSVNGVITAFDPSADQNGFATTELDLDAGAGNDTVIMGQDVPGLTVVQINGGAGADLIEVAAQAPQTTYLFGGTGWDFIVGDDQPNHIVGGPGNDTIFGGMNTDAVWGGRGSDSIFGGLAGFDTMLGGMGSDIIIAAPRSTGSFLGGGNGNDSLEGFNTIIGGATANTSTLSGGSGFDVAWTNPEVLNNTESISQVEFVIPALTADWDPFAPPTNGGPITVTFPPNLPLPPAAGVGVIF